MDFATKLAALLLLRWSTELGIGGVDNRYEDKKPEVNELTQMFVEVAKEGALVDPETDAMILATQSWYESRLSLRPPDGDPRYQMGKKVGTVVGPMQVSKAAVGWIPLWPESTTWKGLTVEKMRDPKTNVQLAYDILKHWKNACKGTPGVWIAAYGMGKCPAASATSYASIGWEGRRRCKTLNWMMKKMEAEQAYTIPADWSCGPAAPKAP